MTFIAPSILAADFSKLGEEIKLVTQAGADWIHLDIMDGHFVPNLTFGPQIVKTVRKLTNKFLDTHLMIEKPEDWVEKYAKAGSDQITVHAEACEDLSKILKKIRGLNKKAGVSLKPSTPVSVLDNYWDLIDCVLIMTVDPGFGGQKFMPDQIAKIAEIKQKSKCLIEIDGGINLETAEICRKAGADILVAGSYIFSSKDYEKAILTLRA